MTSSGPNRTRFGLGAGSTDNLKCRVVSLKSLRSFGYLATGICPALEYITRAISLSSHTRTHTSTTHENNTSASSGVTKCIYGLYEITRKKYENILRSMRTQACVCEGQSIAMSPCVIVHRSIFLELLFMQSWP